MLLKVQLKPGRKKEAQQVFLNTRSHQRNQSELSLRTFSCDEDSHGKRIRKAKIIKFSTFDRSSATTIFWESFLHFGLQGWRTGDCSLSLARVLSLIDCQLPIEKSDESTKWPLLDLNRNMSVWRDYLFIQSYKEQRLRELKLTFRAEWSSGYGWRLMFERLWVWIPAPNTGWIDIFSHWFVVTIVFCLKRPKINEKRPGLAHFFKSIFLLGLCFRSIIVLKGE